MRNDGFFVHSQSQNSSQVLTNGLSGASLCFGSGLGVGGGTRSPVKSPQNRLRRLLLSKLVHPLFPSLAHPPPHQLSLSHTHTHIQMHAWTQTAGWVVPPGTLRESAAGPAERSYHPTPPGRPLSPSGRDDRLINLRLTSMAGFQENRAPAAKVQPSQSVHQPWASGGPAADPNLSRVSPTFAPGPRGQATLRDVLDGLAVCTVPRISNQASVQRPGGLPGIECCETSIPTSPNGVGS